MALSNTSSHYGGVTKTFHWLTALLILTLIPLGWYAEELPYQTDAELARKAWLFSLHKTLGVTAFFVAVLRILWALTQPKPGLLNAERKLESLAAEVVHWLLYAALVIVPLSGWISHAAAEGFAPIWWPLGQGLPLVPKSVAVEHVFSGIHGIATKVLIAAILLHIAGALKHHLIDRDPTLRRMLPGRPTVAPLPAQPAHTKPALAAAAIWAAAVALGAGLALASEKEPLVDVALEEVSSEWTVEDGTIEITVVQFGNEVTGSFAEWTSAITFDETIDIGEVGTVTTTIAIPSLTLGSVTQQAMGADFFDAQNHATAVFDAIIRHTSDGYEAVGTLRIKDMTVPLTMPFNLALKDGNSEMRADLTLDRRDFNIGNNVGDEASLAFDVRVAIRLTATRGVE
ncbi:cytochrome b/b6 domain-containing protein [Marimonas sp. MJW-29]|uniref:Cytochrome b/b6 domain-containing protein n=1 Tax=Sulfitobacter sediminis TaxID=3234186 RepID=A0ABV3RHV8_9RHOB